MAVTLTIAELLIAALRLNDSTEETAEVTRLLAYATEAVAKHAPNAPNVAHNEAVRRIVGHLFDQPEAARGDAYANAMRNSGAARILLPYRVHRAGYADAVEAAQAAVGTPGNPVVGIDINGVTLTVTFADGSTEEHTLPADGMNGGTGSSLTFVGNDTVTAQIAAIWYTTSIQAPTTAFIGFSIDGPLPTDGIAIFPNTLIGDVPVIPGSAATLGDNGHTFSVDAGGRLAMAPRKAGVYEIAVYSLEGS